MKTYIEAYHDAQLTMTDDYNMRPIFQAGMSAGPKLEVVHKTTKIIDPDPTKAMAPDQNLRISRVVTSPTRIRSIQYLTSIGLGVQRVKG